MARRKQEKYVFNAAARTVKIPAHIEVNDVLTIINVTAGVVIYSLNEIGKGFNPSNPKDHTHPLLGTDPDFPWSIDGVCTFNLEFDTSSMNDDDELLMYIEDERRGLTVRAPDAGLDAIERAKVSTPQTLIDADFEYGLQGSKWTQIGFNAGYPSFSESIETPLPVTGISAVGNLVTVNQNGHDLLVGDAINITGLESQYSGAEGSFVIAQTTANTYQFRAKDSVTGVSLTPYTSVRKATIYDQAALDFASYEQSGTSIVTVSFNTPHGLYPGSPFILVDTAANIQTQEGPFFVKRVVDNLTFEYDCGTVASTGGPINSGVTVYAVSNSIFEQQAFSGGIELSTFYPIIGLEAKRQTKRYFRYQAAKGFNFATGVQFSPSYDIISATYDGSNITVQTSEPHGFQAGVKVALSDIDSVGYNTTVVNYINTDPYTISSISSSTTFVISNFGVGQENDGLDTGIVDATANLGITPKVVAIKWRGAAIRVGMFDDQNGPYWEYNGETLYACIRDSTTVVTGNVDLVNGSNLIQQSAGSTTRFGDQFVAGNRVLIKGQVYEVSEVANSSTMYINPAYRGESSSGSRIALIRDVRIPSSQFNADTIDGNGPSGYYLHPDRIQMLGMQFSWYGAGYIDYQVRGPLGDYITVHRIANANFKNEAYMRTANLPARYEVVTSCRHSKLLTLANAGDTTLTVANADKLFPTDGGVLTLKSNGILEIVSYTSITGNTISGVTRAASYSRYLGGVGNQTFDSIAAQTHPAGSSVQFLGSNIAPKVSHWGSSVILDGGFDEDTGFRFTASRNGLQLSSGTGNSRTALLFRPAPAVSNTLPGLVGERELLNRSRIQLDKIDISLADTTPGALVPRRIEIAGILNPTNALLDPQSITWSAGNTQTYGAALSTGYQPSFVQYNNTEDTAPTGGQILFKYVITESAILDLSNVRELENSFLGGNKLYPNGPEMLAILITNLDTGSDITTDIVLSWKEAQT